ncbi:acyl carrier protein [Streptomyces ureilyticus]|jgi:acyl carrier protein|uniref:Acyl carrier protein n=1 Tax=Streptomyces ureilyticus TaxID=1775131 RepID=A0ABX0E7S3_9ACTN|nr:acyl carrier protein [Streptomyces ureilyticus]NGO47342.1 acyl carrier protein [Streptomyces ureilyticus]
MPDQEMTKRIAEYIREKFLDGDPQGELQDTSPLLEWGVLNSLRVAQLIGFLREEFGVVVPPREIHADNLRDVRSITAMVARLA